MSGFSNWSAPPPDPQETPRPTSQHPLADDLARRLPARRSPSALDQMLERARTYTGSLSGTASQYLDFSDLMSGRVDGPFYTGIRGRAAICLQLSSEWVTGLDDLRPVADDGATLHAMAWTAGYPLLRCVIEFPRRMDLYFESLLDLTEGNVQEFVIDAVSTEKVELHLTVGGDTRELALGCRAPRLRTVLGGVVETLCGEDHPHDPGLVRTASNRARMAYPAVNSGLAAATGIVLEPADQVARFVKIDLHY